MDRCVVQIYRIHGSRSRNTLSCSLTFGNTRGECVDSLPITAPVQMFVRDTVDLLELKYVVGTIVKSAGDEALLIKSTANESLGCGFAHTCQRCPAVSLSWSTRVPGDPAHN